MPAPKNPKNSPRKGRKSLGNRLSARTSLLVMTVTLIVAPVEADSLVHPFMLNINLSAGQIQDQLHSGTVQQIGLTLLRQA